MSEPVQQSSRRVTNSSLFFLEVLVLHASLIHFDALDGDDTLLGREEPCIRWRVWEEEPGFGHQSTNVRGRRRRREATYQKMTATTNVMAPVIIINL